MKGVINTQHSKHSTKTQLNDVYNKMPSKFVDFHHVRKDQSNYEETMCSVFLVHGWNLHMGPKCDVYV